MEIHKHLSIAIIKYLKPGYHGRFVQLLIYGIPELGWPRHLLSSSEGLLTGDTVTVGAGVRRRGSCVRKQVRDRQGQPLF